LNRSLSVLLPVHNVQASLAARVEEILEVLPELTDRFELIMTDHGSTDGTWEIARELARQYPQVRLLREPARSATASAIRLRLDTARGDVVIAHDGGPGIDVRAIARLWRSANSARTLERDDGFRLVWPNGIEALRRPVAAVKEIARKNMEPEATPRSAATIDSADRKTRRPNFLSRFGTRVRNFTAGE